MKSNHRRRGFNPLLYLLSYLWLKLVLGTGLKPVASTVINRALYRLSYPRIEILSGWQAWERSKDLTINSRLLYRLSYMPPDNTTIYYTIKQKNPVRLLIYRAKTTIKGIMCSMRPGSNRLIK